MLDAAGQGNAVKTAIDDMLLGVTTPSQLLAGKKRASEHDACVDVTAECPKTPADKPLFIHALAMREYLEVGWVDRLWWFDTLAMLADGMTTRGHWPRTTSANMWQKGHGNSGPTAHL